MELVPYSLELLFKRVINDIPVELAIFCGYGDCSHDEFNF